MSITYIDSCGNETGDWSFFEGVIGNASVVTGGPFSGPRAYKLYGGYVEFTGASGDDYTDGAKGRQHVRFRVDSAACSAGLCGIVGVARYGSPYTYRHCVALNSSRKLVIAQLFPNSSTTYATGTTTIAADTTYELTFAWTVTSGTVNSFRVFLNGSLEVSCDNVTLSGTGFGDSFLGYNDATGAYNILIGDFIIDNSNSLADMGERRVTAKRPAATATNQFDTTGGSGANRWDYVDEVPRSDTNYIKNTAAGDYTEVFTLESESAGDVNVSGATFHARRAWARVARNWATANRTYNASSRFWAISKTSGTTLVMTSAVGDAPPVGSTLLIAFAMDGASGTVSATDNASTPNTYVVDADAIHGSPGATNVRAVILRAYIANNTNLTTVTITHPTVTARAGVGKWYTDILQTSPLDKTATATGASNSIATGATGTTSQNDEIIFVAMAAECVETEIASEVATGLSPAVAGRHWESTSGGGGASNVTVVTFYAGQQIAATQSPQQAVASSVDWAAAVATYKTVTGGTQDHVDVYVDNTTYEFRRNNYITTGSPPAEILEVIYESSAYPSATNGIGIKSSGGTADTTLYECGVAVAFTPAAGIIGTASESATAADTQTAGGTFGVTVSESATAADAPSGTQASERSVAESASAADAVSGGKLATGSVSETAPMPGLVDNAFAARVASGAIAESATAVDSQTVIAVFRPTVSESATATDAPSGTQASARAISEAASAADDLSATKSGGTQTGDVAETATAADAPNATQTSARAASESATAADAPNATQASARAASEAASAADAASATKATAGTIAEATAASESQSVIANLNATASEAASAAESAAANWAGARAAAESASAADAPDATQASARSVAESASAADAVSGGKLATGTTTEAAAGADEQTATQASARAVTEATAAADAQTVTATFAGNAIEAASAAESQTVAGAFAADATEATSAAESQTVTATLNATAAEAASAADDAGGVAFQNLRPASTISGGSWVSSLGGALADAVNEHEPNTTDFIESSQTAGDTCELLLSSAPDPGVSDNHYFEYVYCSVPAGGSLTLGIYCGTTLITTATHTNVGASWGTGTLTLTGPQIDAINDYGDARMQAIAN